MQFLSLAIAQALLATAMAVPVANSLFSLTAFDSELFPEGKVLTAKPDGSIWLATPNGDNQLVVASLNEDNLIQGLQVLPDHSLAASTDGTDSLTLSSDAFLTEDGVNKATVCISQDGNAQMFWGNAVCDNKHTVSVRANPISESIAGNLALKNNFCFCGGCNRHEAPKCAPPAPAPKCASPPVRHEPFHHKEPTCSGSNCGDCGSCLECGGCPAKCGCGWKDILCPSKWCGICKGSDCHCEKPAERPIYTRIPVAHPTRTVTVIAEPVHTATAHEPCHQCGSVGCNGASCPAEKCGGCLKDILECVCPFKKVHGCHGGCNPPCSPECGVHAEPCEQPHHQPHTILSTVTLAATPTAPAVNSPVVTEPLTTTRTHFVTVSSPVRLDENAAARPTVATKN